MGKMMKFGLLVVVAGLLITTAGVPTILSQSRSQDERGGRPSGSSWRRPDYSHFNIDVLVDGRPQQEFSARGRRYIEAVEGAEYAIRVTNPLPVRVAVALSVDGLNTVDARRTSSWDASKWILMPYQSMVINGWQMSSVRARQFYFTSERDSYGAKLGQTSNLGVISAVFYRERESAVPVTPPMESSRRRESMESKERSAPGAATADSQTSRQKPTATPSEEATRSDDYAATGIGRSVRHDVQWVALDLQRQQAAEISLRYEYRPELIRLGVILPRRYPVEPLRNRENATGFDNRSFSPEP
ncbi:MAG: hypothetical protein WKF84_08780 [Pyrinomonadaceae bacterium]